MTKDDIQDLIDYIPLMDGYTTNATLQDIESALVQLFEENEKLKEPKICCPHCARQFFLTPEGQKLVESLGDDDG